MSESATPPTPDRAAVREALVQALATSGYGEVRGLVRALSLPPDSSLRAVADALLSRAQPEGEAVREAK